MSNLPRLSIPGAEEQMAIEPGEHQLRVGKRWAAHIVVRA